MKKVIFVLSIIASSTSYAITVNHAGGTDAMGCHVDHRTGVWHCH